MSNLSATIVQVIHFQPLVFVQLIPLCLSLGSVKRSYQSVTVNRDDFTLDDGVTPQNLSWLPSKPWPPVSWVTHAQQNPWEYLLQPPKRLGNLICVSRGKLLVLAAGNVSHLSYNLSSF